MAVPKIKLIRTFRYCPVAVMFSLIMLSDANATVFKCVSEKGKVSYQEEPCATAKSREKLQFSEESGLKYNPASSIISNHANSDKQNLNWLKGKFLISSERNKAVTFFVAHEAITVSSIGASYAILGVDYVKTPKLIWRSVGLGKSGDIARASCRIIPGPIESSLKQFATDRFQKIVDAVSRNKANQQLSRNRAHVIKCELDKELSAQKYSTVTAPDNNTCPVIYVDDGAKPAAHVALFKDRTLTIISVIIPDGC